MPDLQIEVGTAESGGRIGVGMSAAVLDPTFMAQVVAGVVDALLAHPNAQNGAALFTNAGGDDLDFLPGAGIAVADAGDVASAVSGAFLAGETLAELRTFPSMTASGTDYSADFGANPFVKATVNGTFTLETCTIPAALIGGQVEIFFTTTGTTPNFINGDTDQHVIQGGLPVLAASKYYRAVGDVIAGPKILWTFSAAWPAA